MELDLGTNVGNNKTNEIEKFTKELNNALKEDKSMSKVTKAIEKILKFALEKLVELVKYKQ